MKHFVIILFLLVSGIGMAQNKLAFVNGKIYTVNDKQPLAESVVIENNKIIFVGSNNDAEKFIDASTEKINLQGKFMMPGFIDNHVHFLSGGFYLNGIDLRPAKSTSEFKKILKEYASTHQGKWITGGNWDHEAWEVKDIPTKEMVDEFTSNTPILIDRFDGHMALTNSYTLKLAGITKDTESPEGGLIVKDKNTGEPTGILKDNAISLVSKFIPASTEDEYYTALLTALDHAKQLGVTSVQDITYSNDLKAYRRAEKENKLTCRIYTRMPIESYQKLIDDEIKVPSGSDKLKMGSLKAFADGSLGSSTAWFFERYDQDTLTTGLAMDIVTNGCLEIWAMDADKNHLQISTHAIGDKANSYMLNVYENIKNKNPVWDRRFRIEHAQHVRLEDVKRFAEIGVIASVQPYHLIDDGVWAEKRIGKKRINEAYPLKDFLDNGVKMCFGTDWTVAPLNPLLGIYAAVTRRTLDDKNPDGWIPEQKISLEDAIKCYTINCAYASFEEDIKGTIETGKLADLIVLSEDIFSIDPIKIKDVKVEMTVFDGEVIYKK
ncbi:MAG: amidohydrolase [Ignavibacteria bacterium CG_4_9_14_3_um_filter_36_18]|nr:MAG: amidohydrolase [Ignavibacteria bacterium CG_4_9_14_3_um_filter_36_18]